MDYEFDRHIALQPLGEGEYAAELNDGWVVGGGVNGGYLLAIVGQAIRFELAEGGHPDPVSISGYYLSSTVPGPATVKVQMVRDGKTRVTVTATLSQLVDGVPVERLTALAMYGDLAQMSDDIQRSLPPVELPPVEDCIDARQAPEEVRKIAPLLERFGTRLDPACVGWAVRKPSGNGVIQGWFKLADDRPLDPIALLMVVDALPPVTFDLGLPGWAPTLELTAYVRADPAPGWARVRHATRTIAGGYFEEDCEVWDSTGRLVAQSRQLALVPRPVGVAE